ncbi:uncharacterized protein J7T54_004588 [Emericellopsis cladophorae]|uniref:Cytochrome P450 n=1 Tax=Emericellopsis cladophorae TaxID=2686198 RepID=A0A9Q0BG15_9HYPO|nr:uncharacterized protein J7T54_004588 [Emericellopsis cladophorae]KAI6784042.1 hypothetical protein J7T54_004588 [Emericellopsis cladophorae]
MRGAWITLACLLGAYVAFSRFRAWRRLAHIPGPKIAGFTDLWLIYKTWRGSLFEDLGEVCKRHGPLARIAPNHVVCGDPREVRRLWAVRSQFDRAPWYKGFRLDPPNDCTLSMCDADIHTALRAKLAPGYGGKDIVGLHEHIDEGIARFVKLLEDKYLSTPDQVVSVDFSRKVQYMTLDIISKIAFGEAFGFMDNDADFFRYIKTTEDTIPMMQMFALVPWLVDILQGPLGKSMMPTERDAFGLGPIMATAKRVVAERFGEKKVDKPDMLGSFVRHGLDQREAEAESLVQIIAGSDTTATALRTIMTHVMTNLDVYRRLQAEIDQGIAEGRISTPITDAEARKLPYLQGCIKEGFRIWPPITGVMPRISDEDATVCGVHIPAGTNVAWSAHAALRDREVFGADADFYRPDRWVRATEEEYRLMDNSVDLCFGSGRWGCLGRPVATIELNKMVPELLRRFDFAALNTERPIVNKFHGVLIQQDLVVQITKRA